MKSLRVTIASLSAVFLVGSLITAVAPAQAGSAEKVEIATYNICRPKTCGDVGGTWPERKKKILRTIEKAKPQLLALQEVDDYDGTAKEFEAELADQGYQIAPVGSDRCRPVSCANRIFYRTATFRLLPEGGIGSVEPSAFTSPDHYDDDVKDRPLGYALLEHLKTGKRIFAVSLHLPPQHKQEPKLAEQARAARNDMAKGLPKWVDQHLAQIGGPAPIQLFMGDVNATLGKENPTPQKIWNKQGYTNAEKAKKAINTNYGTINKTGQDSKWDGFPPKPRYYNNGSPKIDVIYSKGIPKPKKYEIVLNLKKNGKFDKKYHGSDHNMVRAVIKLS
ncbi:MAG: hypothetical protein K0U60_06895 [Actinomycetia bacterium]|nr:hypothetical protein [Actinomycetes bacterium]MCH9801290.1 hypothetical protein [Actinomycetes bacterium]